MVVPRGRPRGRLPPLVIVVCWKWIAVDGDERWAGVSDADRAALEIGLRLAESAGDAVTVVTVGGSGRRARAAVGARRRRPPGRAHRRARRAGQRGRGVGDRRRRRRRHVGASAATCRPTGAPGRSRRSSPPSSAPPRRSGSSAWTSAPPARPVAERRRARRAPARRRPPRGARRRRPGRALGRGLGGPAAAGLAAGRGRRPHGARSRTWPGRADRSTATDVVQPYRPRARALAAPSGEALDRVRLLTDPSGGGGAGVAHRARDARAGGGRRPHPRGAGRVGLPAALTPVASVVPGQQLAAALRHHACPASPAAGGASGAAPRTRATPGCPTPG